MVETNLHPSPMIHILFKMIHFRRESRDAQEAARRNLWHHVLDAGRLHIDSYHVLSTGEGCGETKCPHRVLSAHRSQPIFPETIQTGKVDWIHDAFLPESQGSDSESQWNQEGFRKVSWDT